MEIYIGIQLVLGYYNLMSEKNQNTKNAKPDVLRQASRYVDDRDEKQRRYYW